MKFSLIVLIGAVMGLQAAEYGAWESPITAEMLAHNVVRFQQIEVENDQIYWLESRVEEEQGRSVVVHFSDTKEDLIPSPFYARTLVHEYGGRCCSISNGTLYFTNFKDQHIYQVEPKGKPTALVTTPNMRFADFVIHPNGRWMYSVIEDHANPKAVKNGIAKIDLETGQVEVLAKQHDFYAAPRISPDGSKLAFIFWDQPNMPWDGTELWVSDLNEKGLIDAERKIAGGASESVLEPTWSPKGDLYFVSDRNGYWNLYDEDNQIVVEMSADFTSPPWGLGNRHYTFVEIDSKPFIAAIYTEKATDYLGLIDLEKRALTKVPLDFTSLTDIHTVKHQLVFVASSPSTPSEIVKYNLKTREFRSLAKSQDITIDPEYFSYPKTIEYPTENEKTAFAFYFAPTNPKYKGPTPESKPPLIVFAHGGPTAHVAPDFKLPIQFWTSRGFAVAVVNYGGSTGYGREYRDRLKGKWGVVDVDDCCNAAKYLIKEGLVDPNRLAIRGGSAGGYTTLAALAFRDIFKVGASHFGVSDLELLAQDDHKFESRYLDSLVGPYPEKKDKYKEFSPINHADKISRPVLFLQGAEDKIVPPNQSELMHEALLKRKIPTAYLLFEGEQHGFRQAKNIIKSTEAEYYFYCRIFNIPTKAPSIPISNL